MRDRRTFMRLDATLLVYLIVSVVVFGAAAAASPAAAAPSAYPKATGNVNDFAGVLSRDDKANLNALTDAVLRQTGTTFAVAIVQDHGDESLETYAANLYEKWGIGEKGKDKGLLVVVSMKDHDLRAEVGYGLEPVITDRRAGESLDAMLPYFKEDQYGKGLYAGLLHAAQYVAKDAGVKLNLKPVTKDYEDIGPGTFPVPAGLGAILAAFVGIPLVLGAVLGIRGKRCPRCKARLTVADRVVQGATYEVGGLAMKTSYCPKCGYRAERPYRTSRLARPGGMGGIPPLGGPFGGGFGGGRSGSRGGSIGPRGFGGGRSGGGGASRKW